MNSNNKHPMDAGIEAHWEGNLSLAVKCFQKAIEKNPQKIHGHLLIDRVLREIGSFNEANTYFDLITKNITQYIQTLHPLSNISANLNKPKKSCALTIISNVDSILDFFHNHNIAASTNKF